MTGYPHWIESRVRRPAHGGMDRAACRHRVAGVRMTAGAVRETTRPLLMGRPVDAGVECRRVVSLTCLAGRSRAAFHSPRDAAPFFNKKHPRRWVGRVRDNPTVEVGSCRTSY